MRPACALALCAVAMLAGCGSFAAPATETDAATDTTIATSPPPAEPTDAATPTETATSAALALPEGVDRDEVVRASSMATGARATFEAARASDAWVELGSASAVETFGDLGYVSADGRVWAVRYVYGTTAYRVEVGNASADEVVAYGNLSAAQRRLFDRVRTGGCCPGPDQEGVTLPDAVRYRSETYLVESGTRSFEYGAIDVDPYEPEATVTGE